VRITVNCSSKPSPNVISGQRAMSSTKQDVLAVQSDVARGVARQIRVKLMPQDQARLATSQRVDPEAYEAYLLVAPTPTRNGKGKDKLDEGQGIF